MKVLLNDEKLVQELIQEENSNGKSHKSDVNTK